jgi:hypothetical protein
MEKNYSFEKVVELLNAQRPFNTKKITLNDVMIKLYKAGYVDRNGQPTQKAFNDGILAYEEGGNLN